MRCLIAVLVCPFTQEETPANRVTPALGHYEARMQPAVEIEATAHEVPVAVWSIPVGLILVVGLVVFLIMRRSGRRASRS